MAMRILITLLACLFILNPCPLLAQPKAQRLMQRMKGNTLSERAIARAAKEKITLQQKRAESLRKRQEALELNQLSEQFGLRVKERIVKKNSKENRQLRKELRRKQQEKTLFANPNFNLKDALTNIIERHPDDVVAALYDMRKMRQKRGEDANPEYFRLFAIVYYKQHLKTLTQHMYEFIDRVAQTGFKSLEKDVMLRMQELFSQKQGLLNSGLRLKAERLRLRYLKNVSRANDLNFNPEDLIFAYEQKVSALPPDFAIRHITANTQIYIGREKIPLSFYSYDISYITELYKQLLNKDGSADDITVILDKTSRQIALYNKDKQVWIRVTPHEYASVNKLHIHLNEVRHIDVEMPNGKHFKDRMLFNVSIPIWPGATRPYFGGKHYDLYEKMVLAPAYILTREKNTNVVYGNIF